VHAVCLGFVEVVWCSYGNMVHILGWMFLTTNLVVEVWGVNGFMNIHGAAVGSWCRSGLMVQQFGLHGFMRWFFYFIFIFFLFGLPFHSKLQSTCSWGANRFTGFHFSSFS